MQESKQETDVFARYQAVGTSAYEMDADCDNCGETWGEHLGIECLKVKGIFSPLCDMPTTWSHKGIQQPAKPALTLGDLLRRAGHPYLQPKPLIRPGITYVCDVPDGLTVTPADLAMIAKDGPARPAPAVIAPAPLITTKPPIAGLTRVSAQDHRVGGWGFVR